MLPVLKIECRVAWTLLLIWVQPFLSSLGSFWAYVKGLSANQMGDVCPHCKGVERIGFPWFPNPRPTEAREQFEQCCLREPVCFFFFLCLLSIQSITVTPFSFLFVHSIIHIYSSTLDCTFFLLSVSTLFFFHRPSFPLLLVSQTLSHAGVAAML